MKIDATQARNISLQNMEDHENIKNFFRDVTIEAKKGNRNIIYFKHDEISERLGIDRYRNLFTNEQLNYIESLRYKVKNRNEENLNLIIEW